MLCLLHHTIEVLTISERMFYITFFIHLFKTKLKALHQEGVNLKGMHKFKNSSLRGHIKATKTQDLKCKRKERVPLQSQCKKVAYFQNKNSYFRIKKVMPVHPKETNSLTIKRLLKNFLKAEDFIRPLTRLFFTIPVDKNESPTQLSWTMIASNCIT